MRRKWIFLVVIVFLLCSCGKNEPTVEPDKHIYDNNTLHEEKEHNSELSDEAKGSWSTEASKEIEKAKEGPEPGKYDKKYDNYGLWPIENIPEVWNAEVDEGDDPVRLRMYNSHFDHVWGYAILDKDASGEQIVELIDTYYPLEDASTDIIMYRKY